MTLIRPLTLLLGGSILALLQSVLSADSACFDIVNLDPVSHSGGMVCTCDSDPGISAQLGTGSNSMTIQTGGPRGPKAVNCYASTTITESPASLIPNGFWLVMQIDVPAEVTTRRCDPSTCGSILFGLIKWGGATCEDVKTMNITVQSWKATGPCDTDPDPEN